MIHIALVDDEVENRKQFLSYLHQYEKESGQQFRISVFSDGDEILASYKADYDLILMDIAMRFMDGMTAAEEIRKLDSEVVIIFITNMPQYVMKGYAVDAMDYVLKPVNYYAFTQRIERAISRMSRRREQYIPVPILTRGPLSEVEARLDPGRFFRCNKYCLVNLSYVDSFQNNDILIGEDHIQVSRARKKAMLDALNNYLNEVCK